MVRERPVQASSARRWATIQSTEPLTWTTAKEVLGDRTDTKAVTGLAEETFWYRNGMPTAALRKGSSALKDETTCGRMTVNDRP